MATVTVGTEVTADLLELMNNPPVVRLTPSGTQSLTDNTATAITFTVEDIDTHNFHDTGSNTSRVTPTIAGYYECRGVVMHGSRNDYANVNAWIRKNGSSNLAGGQRFGPAAVSQIQSPSAAAIVACNGSTDYVELVGLQDNTANAAQVTNQSSQFSCCFEVKFLRPL